MVPSKTIDVDVVVNGAGAVGLAATKVLGDRGLRVALVDREDKLASGPSTRNEGILHAGSVHAAAVEDEAVALQVARRVRYGLRTILAWAPEAVEDVDQDTFLLVARQAAKATCVRWEHARVWHRQVEPGTISEPALNPELHDEYEFYQVDDLAIDTRKLYQKLAGSAAVELRGWEIREFTALDEGGSTVLAEQKTTGEVVAHFPQVATAISAPIAWLGSRVQEGLWRHAEEGQELTL